MKPLQQPPISTIADYRLTDQDQPFSHVGINIFGPFKVYDQWSPKAMMTKKR